MDSRRTLADLGITEPALARMEWEEVGEDYSPVGRIMQTTITATQRPARCINEGTVLLGTQATAFERTMFQATVNVGTLGGDPGDVEENAKPRLFTEMADIIRKTRRTARVWDRVAIDSRVGLEQERGETWAVMTFWLYIAEFDRMRDVDELAGELGGMILDP